MELLEVETMDIALWEPEIIISPSTPASRCGRADNLLACQDDRIPAQLKQTNCSIVEVVRNNGLVTLGAQMCVLWLLRSVGTLCIQLWSK